MRTRFFFFIAGIVANFVVSAQSHSFGLHVIGNYTNFQAKVLPLLGEQFPKWKTGYGLGGNFTYDLGQKIGLRGEVNFERLGAKYDFVFTDENGNPIDNGFSRISLDYISVPVLFQIKTGEKYQFMFHLGMAFKFLLRQSAYLPGEGLPGGVTWPGFDKISDYNRTDQSIQGGVGYSFPFIKSTRIYVNGRYEHGLFNVSKVDEYFTGKNRSFNLLVGIQI